MHERALRAMQVGVVLLDTRRGLVVYRNPAASLLLQGWTEEKQTAQLLALASTHHAISPQTPALLSIGERTVESTLQPVAEGEWCLVLEDATEREQLRRIAEAVSLADNLSVVFASFRHELGNPVNSAKVTLSVLKKRQHSLLPNEIAEYVNRALVEVDRLAFLLQALRSYNLIEKPTRERVDLSTYLQGYTELIKADATARRVVVEVKTMQTAEAVVWADPRALHQVMTNIVANAFDAMKESNERLLTMALLRPSSRWLVLTVADTGIGVPDSFRNTLFKPFVTSKCQGTGLGLVIVQRLMSAMGGKVTLEPAKGSGTKVLLSFSPVETSATS